jgi:hypothetical protein
MLSVNSLQPQSLKLTEVPCGENEKKGAQCNGDHECPDRQSESALTGRFNHECLRIATGDEFAVSRLHRASRLDAPDYLPLSVWRKS